MKTFAFLTTLALTLGTAAVALEGPVPDTISPGAQQFLRQSRPFVLQATTTEEWQAIAGAMGGNAQQTRALTDRWAESIERVEIDGAEHLLITPKSYDPANEKRLVIHVHGGAYVFGSPEGSLGLSLRAAHFSRMRLLSVRYPLAWKSPHPAARDRVVAVYEKLLEDYSPRHIAMTGESAGGSLILSVVLKLRDDGLPMPAVLGLLSPWSDITRTGDSYETNAGFDALLEYEATLEAAAKVYADGQDMKDPSISPIYADYERGFPPSYISTGTRDLFLSNCARLQRKLIDAGVESQLVVYEGMWHVFQFLDIPESQTAWRDMAAFFERHLAR